MFLCRTYYPYGTSWAPVASEFFHFVEPKHCDYPEKIAAL